MAIGAGDPRRARLSGDEERALLRSVARGDQAARDRLVEAFTPLIRSVARTYAFSPAVDRAELVQEGVAGLLEAARRFDADLGTPFWAYASWWVRQGMQRFTAEMTRPIVLSDRAIRQLSRVREARRQLGRSGDQEPSSTGLAAASGLNREQVENLLAADRSARGLEERAFGEEDGPTFGETIADPTSEEPYDRVIEGVEVDLLRELTEDLSDRERAIVSSRFGLGRRRARTLREIAEVLGISAERVRQIEERALSKLRTALEAAY